MTKLMSYFWFFVRYCKAFGCNVDSIEELGLSHRDTN
jgi:hypothetical protein